MCDYSLCGIPNRLAAEGEDLFVRSSGGEALPSLAVDEVDDRGHVRRQPPVLEASAELVARRRPDAYLLIGLAFTS